MSKKVAASLELLEISGLVFGLIELLSLTVAGPAQSGGILANTLVAFVVAGISALGARKIGQTAA